MCLPEWMPRSALNDKELEYLASFSEPTPPVPGKRTTEGHLEITCAHCEIEYCITISIDIQVLGIRLTGVKCPHCGSTYTIDMERKNGS